MTPEAANGRPKVFQREIFDIDRLNEISGGGLSTLFVGKAIAMR